MARRVPVPWLVGGAIAVVLAGGLAWLSSGGVDTGPEVAPAARTAAQIKQQVMRQAEAVRPKGELTAPRPAFDAPDRPASTALGAVRSTLEAPSRPAPQPQPAPEDRSSHPVVVANAENKVLIYDRMFVAAHLAIPDGPEADEARAILDETLAKMEEVVEQVRSSDVAYPIVVAQMAHLRDAAADEIAELVDPATARQVRLRMGLRDPDAEEP